MLGEPSTSANNESVSTQDEAIEILDFSQCKNVNTDFLRHFSSWAAWYKKFKKKEKKEYNAQTKIYRKRKWENIGRNISQAEKETKKAKALKEGYAIADDGITQFTLSILWRQARLLRACVSGGSIIHR